MLKRIRAWRICHQHAAVRGMNKLLRTPLATTMILAVISVALTLPMLLWVLTDNVRHFTTDWKQSSHISLYLDVKLSSSEQAETASRVRELPGVQQARLTSPSEGLAALQQQEGLSDVSRYLSENPLPAVIEITPNTTMDSAEKMEQLFEQLKALPHVEQATLDVQSMDRLYAMLEFATTLTHALMWLLGFAVVMIIGNTLRLLVSQSCEEIRVLKLIGATNAFIARPFLYTSLLYGLVGALGAVLLVKLFLWMLAPMCQHLFKLYHIDDVLWQLSFSQILALLLSAIGLSFLGAMLSVRRQIAWLES